jgi:hypothetical protein
MTPTARWSPRKTAESSINAGKTGENGGQQSVGKTSDPGMPICLMNAARGDKVKAALTIPQATRTNAFT